MSFESLGLAPFLLRALAEQGYETPTPIQQQAIPLALAGRDLLAGAQTGTGKTAAFGLPLLQHLGTASQEVRAGPRKPRALILAPTRELATQVHDSLRGYSKYLRIPSACIYGGVGMGNQLDILRRGVDLLVACPGRLIDHLERRSVDLSGIELLVLDEADRMLDMGFLPSIKRILAKLPKQNRQTLLFSATFEDNIRQLALEFMRNPEQIQVTPKNTVAETITHRVHPVDARSATCCCTCWRRTAASRPWCSHAPSTAATSWPRSWKSQASRPRRSMATRARASACVRWATSRPTA